MTGMLLCKCMRIDCPNAHFDDYRRATDAEANYHMRTNPDHETTIDSDDQWSCLTCEEDEDES